ncbi:AMP-binding protein [Halalkalicoccus tibetensis]|uniref:acetate--CoA ligase n=1 Tax=Halalkalicoccus tibetensis TaxID=175632 RepID=A0ABD5V9S5_9EURY
MKEGRCSDPCHSISPPSEFVEQANVTSPEIYETFEEEWPTCWERAASLLEWHQSHSTVLEPTTKPPYYRWFVGGTLNASYNCVDRHVEAGRGDQPAIQWVRETGGTETYTYADLERNVNAVAASLRKIGVNTGDTVALYLPRLPALPIVMLAAARLGAPHVVVFAEYSADVLASFMAETDAEVLVTADGYHQNGAFHPLEPKANRAIEQLEWDVTTVSVDRTGHDSEGWSAEYDYDELRSRHWDSSVEPVSRESDEPLFVCYASGPTGEPVGMEHATGSYLSYVAWTTHAVLDVAPGDTLWCPAGIEWITGHSYIVYGPLALGATTLLYEGAPAYPDKTRPWEIIAENEVTQFYTTPTAIRAFMEWGSEYPNAHDLSSLKLLGTVGQRIEPETWWWFYEHVGGRSCPIVDTWYQAENGGIAISTLPAIHEMRPGSVGKPLPGIDAEIVDATGAPVPAGQSGYLVFERPWPGFFRPVGDEAAATELWTEFGDPPNEWTYFSEDSAVREDGYMTILGRTDDVINIGHYTKNRVHVSEIERVIESLDEIDDVAVICGRHEIMGEAPYAFVVCESDRPTDVRSKVRETVTRELAAPICPVDVYLVPELPRTYSGGVLREALADLLDGERLGDTELLRNPDVLDNIAVEIRHQRTSPTE